MLRTRAASIVVALILAGCTRDAGTDTGAPPSAPAPAGVEAHAIAPAAAPAEPIYRVPVDDLPSMGDGRALVTVVAFTDYECPFCRRAEDTIAKIRAAHGDDVRVVVAEHPLPMHDHARPAALAALAAANQGRFEQMHAKLFARGGALDDASIAGVARDVGLDLARFDADRASANVADALARAEQLADKLGVRGTPTFFVNGRRVVGAQPLDVIEKVVNERLAAARALVASGVRPSRVYETTIEKGLDRVVDDVAHGGSCGGEPGCGHDDAPKAGEAVEAVPIDGAPARGASAAPITVVAFEDFQCPYCAKAEANLHALEQAHPGQVRVVFKNLPLPFHGNARLAAKAALVANGQGKFWEYHDALFAHQKALDRASLEKYAADVGLDVARFSKDLDDPALDARLDADGADAEALHVNGTPTFFVNGHRVVGAQPVASFEAAIAKR